MQLGYVWGKDSAMLTYGIVQDRVNTEERNLGESRVSGAVEPESPLAVTVPKHERTMNDRMS